VAEVAQAFLVPEATMARRITRAKKKIAATKVPYRVPERRSGAPWARGPGN
jgi:RNA polymerase sigma-70 factor (ECF subfamily)